MKSQEISTSKESLLDALDTTEKRVEYLSGVYNKLNEEGKKELLRYVLALKIEQEKERKAIIDLLDCLNEEGRKKLVEYAQDLVLVDKYKYHP